MNGRCWEEKHLWADDEISELQSEGGAAGAVPRFFAAGALTFNVHGFAGPFADDPLNMSTRN